MLKLRLSASPNFALSKAITNRLHHDAVRILRDAPVSSISLADVNALYVSRHPPPQSVDAFLRDAYQAKSQLSRYSPGLRVRVRTSEPEEGALQVVTQLVPDLHLHAAAEWLVSDIALIASSVFGSLGYEEVSAKLELVPATPCPRWHADNVKLRALVTYVGPGTLYLANRFVQRKWSPLLADLWSGGMEPVPLAAVDESGAVAVEAGDLLLLKGHAWPGNNGLGVVHRSPDMEDQEKPRLLLTIDDFIEEESACSCCAPQS